MKSIPLYVQYVVQMAGQVGGTTTGNMESCSSYAICSEVNKQPRNILVAQLHNSAILKKLKYYAHMHNKEMQGFFLKFYPISFTFRQTCYKSWGGKLYSSPTWDSYTSSCPHLIFAWLQRQACLCFSMHFHAFNLKQMIAGKKKKQPDNKNTTPHHYHLGKASGV